MAALVRVGTAATERIALMKMRIYLGGVILVGTTALVTRQVVSQDERGHAPSASRTAQSQPAAEGDSESLIDVWVRHAMPGAQHRLLDRLVGQWEMTVRYRMNSQAPVVESKGSCTRKSILGGRFVLEEFDGGNLAVPFQGLALYGYDVFEGKYTSVWVDTTSTAVTTSLGTCQQQPCDVIAFAGRHGDPWSGQKRPSRGTTRFVDDNKHVLELYEPDSTGKEFKVLEVTYSRQGH